MDNANYTCQSTGNIVGREGVHSTTYFRVECELDSQLNYSCDKQSDIGLESMTIPDPVACNTRQWLKKFTKTSKKALALSHF